VTLTRVFHSSGARLHGSGTPLTMAEIKAMDQAGIKSVHFADLAEADLVAQRLLSTETVDLRDLAMGDVLADNIFDDDGSVLCPPGTHIDAVILEGKVRDMSGPITIRKRGIQGGPEQIKGYLSLLPRYPPHPPRPDTNVTFVEPAMKAVKHLVAARSKILVTVSDSFQRALMLNICAVEGHEIIDRRWADVSQAEFQSTPFDAIVLDLADASSAMQVLRRSEVFRSVAVLVTSPEGRKSEVFKAITNGANGSIPLPVKRDVMLDRIHGTIQSFGRATKLKPAVLQDRRKQPRDGAHMLCSLADKFLSSSLPVKEATLVDVSDAGLKIEYRRPVWPFPHAYLAHGVHPQHFFFAYAKDNPLGRDVTVTFPQAAGRTLEGHAKFVHISVNGDYETAGLVLQRMQSSVREHMTTARGGAKYGDRPVPTVTVKPQSTIRRPF
jgi:DNA-binding NarL/FixJ family response regulator